jgi:hypothetical protein
MAHGALTAGELQSADSALDLYGQVANAVDQMMNGAG